MPDFESVGGARTFKLKKGNSEDVVIEFPADGTVTVEDDAAVKYLKESSNYREV